MTSSMPPPLPPLTLIVATTPSLGIGLRGTLPWPRLKSDLAFFARVTKRVPPSLSTTEDTQTGNGGIWEASKGRRVKNAVIMGRKTWESIPTRFRPLKERINVVVSRSYETLDLGLPASGAEARAGKVGGEDVLAVGSIESGLRELLRRFPFGPDDVQKNREQSREQHEEPEENTGLARVFVIGGAEIYKLAFGMQACDRVLWTRLSREWECDTFFPEGVLNGKQELAETDNNEVEKKARWARSNQEKLDSWAGEKGVGGTKHDGDVEFEVMMMEKESSGDR